MNQAHRHGSRVFCLGWVLLYGCTGADEVDSNRGGNDDAQPATCSPALAHPPGSTTIELEHGGTQRDYVQHVPTGYDGTQRLPLVVDIHGYTSWAAQQLERDKWDAMADKEKFVVVAPDGIDKSWNAGNCCGSSKADDVGFIRALVERASSELCIDPKRVYATGHSNGGMMAFRLGCEAADVFAAIAPVCGTTMPATCKPSRPISVAAIRALEDATVRYDGGGFVSSAKADLDEWLGFDECADTPVVPSHDGVCTTHTGCAGGTNVMECHPHGGHGFFYSTDNADNVLVPDTVWPFFKQFALP